MSPTNNMDIPFSLFVALIGWGSYPINITPLLISIVKLSQRTWQLQFFTHAKNAVFYSFFARSSFGCCSYGLRTHK